eukprot:m.247269 g.247269  ORF g.247269 m.247269 type:complete len:913 (-) comp17482_c0_seq5:57-2795(-)
MRRLLAVLAVGWAASLDDDDSETLMANYAQQLDFTLPGGSSNTSGVIYQLEMSSSLIAVRSDLKVFIFKQLDSSRLEWRLHKYFNNEHGQYGAIQVAGDMAAARYGLRDDNGHLSLVHIWLHNVSADLQVPPLDISEYLPASLHSTLEFSTLLFNGQQLVVTDELWVLPNRTQVILTYDIAARGQPIVNLFPLRFDIGSLTFALNSTVLSVLGLPTAANNKSLARTFHECTFDAKAVLACKLCSFNCSGSLGRGGVIYPTRLLKSDDMMVQSNEHVPEYLVTGFAFKSVLDFKTSSGLPFTLSGSRLASLTTLPSGKPSLFVRDQARDAVVTSIQFELHGQPETWLYWQTDISVSLYGNELVFSLRYGADQFATYVIVVEKIVCVRAVVSRHHQLSLNASGTYCPSSWDGDDDDQDDDDSVVYNTTSTTSPSTTQSGQTSTDPTSEITTTKPTSTPVSTPATDRTTQSSTRQSSSISSTTATMTSSSSAPESSTTLTSSSSSSFASTSMTAEVTAKPNMPASSSTTQALIISVGISVGLIVCLLIFLGWYRAKTARARSTYGLLEMVEDVNKEEDGDDAMLLPTKPMEQAEGHLHTTNYLLPSSLALTPPGSVSPASYRPTLGLDESLPGLQEPILVCLRGLDAARLKQTLGMLGPGPLQGTTYLHFLASLPAGDLSDTLSCVYALITFGLSLEAVDDDLCTPLLLAAKIGNPVMFYVLRSLDARVDGHDDRHRNLLTLACCSGNVDMLGQLNYLSEEDLKPFELDVNGRAALHWLLCVGDPYCLTCYVKDLKLPLCVLDSLDNTCWHYVVKEDRHDLVPALRTLRRGEAKLLILLPNAEGATPLQQAQMSPEGAPLAHALNLIVEQQRKAGESNVSLAIRLRRAHQARIYRLEAKEDGDGHSEDGHDEDVL